MTTNQRTWRVLHVINSLGVSGGAEQQLVANLSRFRDPRLEHHVIYLYEYDFETRVQETAATCASLGSIYGVGERRSRPRTIRRLDRAVREIQPDLMHCTLADASLATRLVGWRRNIPVIESLVNISHEKIRTADNVAIRPWKLRAHTYLDRLTMQRVVRFHALSPAVAESWVRVVGIRRERMTVIPRGVDIDALQARAREGAGRAALLRELDLPDDAAVILSVGRLEPQKGQRYLVRAMPMILEECPDAVLLIAGRPGAAEASIRAEIEMLGIGTKTRLLGRRTDVAALVAGCDVFAFPSLHEGLGVALLEAMALGAAVVTTDTAPMNQVVHHGVNGCTFPLRDTTSMAEIIIGLLQDPGRSDELGTAAQDEIRSSYQLDDSVSRTEQMYFEVLSSKTGEYHADASRGRAPWPV